MKSYNELVQQIADLYQEIFYLQDELNNADNPEDIENLNYQLSELTDDLEDLIEKLNDLVGC